MKDFFKSKKGITLVALVITIVVLIILAGVIISITLGNGGIIDSTKTAKEKYQNAQSYEEKETAKLPNQIDELVSSNSRLANENLSKILWENPNPLSSFSTQTITLNDNIENYTFYEIVYYNYYPGNDNVVNEYNNIVGSTGLIPVGDVCVLRFTDWVSRVRKITQIQNNKITFSDCYYFNTYTNSTKNTNNAVIIPYKVIGLNL